MKKLDSYDLFLVAIGILAGYFLFRQGTLSFGTAILGFIAGFWLARLIFYTAMKVDGITIKDGHFVQSISTSQKSSGV